MQVGVISFFQHAVPGIDDGQFVQEEFQLAVRAEDLGFDFIGLPEHHFEDYSMCVDNIQALSYLAGKTSTIGLMTAVVVLPWHDPVRVAERMIFLDHMSNGRAMFGIGRGLAPREYAAFRIDQNEARARYDEIASMVLAALETGILEGKGPYYECGPLELRPRPLRSFRDRLFGVANSPQSAEAAARLGTRLTMAVSMSMDKMMPTIELYRKTWLETHHSPPPGPLLTDYTFCTRDAALVRQAREVWYPRTWDMIVDHYGLGRVDFTQIRGYETYGAGKQAPMPRFEESQVWGAPEEIIERWEERLKNVDDAMAGFIFRVGGMPYEVVEHSLSLFAEEVLPELKKLGVTTGVASVPTTA
jgi:alkanesulfonate monooxygenase SsuD/methylene tetrahydromethanopterin reductase-like flavin-dependent oxidoreductase (luciferase family)